MKKKIMLVLQKLGAHGNTKYTNYILPNKTEEMSFEETIETLSKIFGERDSLFHTRYKCLNIIKDEDFVAYAVKVNAHWERFKLNDLKEDMFKCLIFVQGLTSNKDKVIRSKILTILEQDTEITLQKVSEECQKLINIRRNNICILFPSVQISRAQGSYGFVEEGKGAGMLFLGFLREPS